MKKLYMQPCVEATQLQLSSIILAGSDVQPVISGGGGTYDNVPGGSLGD